MWSLTCSGQIYPRTWGEKKNVLRFLSFKKKKKKTQAHVDRQGACTNYLFYRHWLFFSVEENEERFSVRKKYTLRMRNECRALHLQTWPWASANACRTCNEKDYFVKAFTILVLISKDGLKWISNYLRWISYWGFSICYVVVFWFACLYHPSQGKVSYSRSPICSVPSWLWISGSTNSSLCHSIHIVYWVACLLFLCQLFVLLSSSIQFVNTDLELHTSLKCVFVQNVCTSWLSVSS